MIELRQVSRCRAEENGLSDIGIKLRNGAVYGILDVCGKGGSALLALMAGAILPESGSVRMNGFDTRTDAQRARLSVGYLPADTVPYPEMTPEEYLSFVADAKGIDFEISARAVQELLDEVELRGKRHVLCKWLTSFELRRLLLAQALLGDAEFVLMDEPIRGLSERDAREMMTYIWNLGEKKTVVINSTSPALLRELCDEVIVLDGGKLLDVLLADDPALESLYRELCARHGKAAEDADALLLNRRQRRNRRAVNAEESRG